MRRLFVMGLLVCGVLWAHSSEVERLALGREAYEREAYLEALDYIRTVLKNNPSYGDAYLYLARVYYALGEYRQAVDAAQQALKFNREDRESVILLANSYRELKDYKKAEELYQSVLRKYPALAAAHREMGILYLMQNRLSLALQSLQRALRYDPDDWQNAVAMGRYYQARGQYDNAEALFAKALRIEPRQREPYLALGSFYFQTGQYTKAVQVLKGAVENFDHFVSGREVLGDTYLSMGDYANAFQQYQWLENERVYRKPDEQAKLAYKMALALGGQKQEDAVLYYQKAIRLDASHQFYEFGYQEYIQSHEEVGSENRQNEAQRVYKEAKRAKANGDLKLFFVLLSRALKLHPYLTDARLDMIAFYESRGMWTEAYEELQLLQRFHYDVKVRDRLSRYDWEISHGNIVIDKPSFYVYKAVVFVDSDYLNFADVYQNLLIEYSKFFGKFKFQGGDIRKTKSTREILSLLRQEEYDFFVRGSVSPTRESIHFEIVDRNNTTLAEKTFPLDERTMGANVWRVVGWFDEVLPTFYRLKSVITRKQYVLAAGSLQGVKEKEVWVGFEGESGEVVIRAMTTSVKKNETTLEALPQGSRLDYSKKEELYFCREKDFKSKDLTKLKFILGY